MIFFRVCSFKFSALFQIKISAFVVDTLPLQHLRKLIIPSFPRVLLIKEVSWPAESRKDFIIYFISCHQPQGHPIFEYCSNATTIGSSYSAVKVDLFEPLPKCDGGFFAHRLRVSLGTLLSFATTLLIDFPSSMCCFKAFLNNSSLTENVFFFR